MKTEKQVNYTADQSEKPSSSWNGCLQVGHEEEGAGAPGSYRLLERKLDHTWAC